MTASKSRDIENIGQLLIIGFDGTEMTPRVSSLLTRLQPAGVILFARNIQNPEQTWRLLRECQKRVTTPLLTCVDLEGGTVDRFRDALLTEVIPRVETEYLVTKDRDSRAIAGLDTAARRS